MYVLRAEGDRAVCPETSYRARISMISCVLGMVMGLGDEVDIRFWKLLSRMGSPDSYLIW